MTYTNYLNQLLGECETIYLDSFNILHFKANEKCSYQLLITDSGVEDDTNPCVEYYAQLPANYKVDDAIINVLQLIVRCNQNSSQPMAGLELISLNELKFGDFDAVMVTPYTVSFIEEIKSLKSFSIEEKDYMLSGMVFVYDNEVNQLQQLKNLKSNFGKAMVINRVINKHRKNYIENPLVVDALFAGASNPGCLYVSKEKMKEMGGKFAGLKYGEPGACLMSGDVQPAIVIHENPYIIACYSSEYEHVLNLEVEENIAKQYDLKVGARLVTGNEYSLLIKQKDILYGENIKTNLKSRYPTLLNFFSDENVQLEYLTSLFRDELYEKTFQLGIQRMNEYDNSTREAPFRSGLANRKFKRKQK